MLPNEQLPLSWKLVQLTEIAELIRGVSYKKEHATDSAESEHMPLLRATNITGTSLTFNDPVYVPESYVNKHQILEFGDVVIASSSGSKDVVGKSGQFKNNFWRGSFGAFCTVVRPSVYIDAKYIGYYFQTSDYRNSISDLSAGSNIYNIKNSDLASHLIPLAPLKEQTRIVVILEEILSDLDVGVAELKAAQRKLARYRQSLLKAAVEGELTAEWRTKNEPKESGAQLLQRILRERRARWEEKQLVKFKEQGKKPPKGWRYRYQEPAQPDIAKLPELPERWGWASIEQIVSDERYSLAIGPFGSNLKVPDYRNAGVPLIFVRNIRSGKYGGTHTQYVTPEKAAELNAHSVAPCDVLVTKMGEPPGDADVYPDDQPNGIITADCIKIRCWRGVIKPMFIKAVINSYIGRRQIEPITQGVAQKKVSLGRFSSLAVPIPPTDEQIAILDILSAADREAMEQEASLEFILKRSAAQRKNVLESAFSGQLAPQNPHDEPASVLLERIREERKKQAAQPKQRKAKVTMEVSAVERELIDVLNEAGDWISAQEAFRRCGIADGSTTDQVEELYAELRRLDKDKRVIFEPVLDANGVKQYDRLRLSAKE